MSFGVFCLFWVGLLVTETVHDKSPKDRQHFEYDLDVFQGAQDTKNHQIEILAPS